MDKRDRIVKKPQAFLVSFSDFSKDSEQLSFVPCNKGICVIKILQNNAWNMLDEVKLEVKRSVPAFFWNDETTSVCTHLCIGEPEHPGTKKANDTKEKEKENSKEKDYSRLVLFIHNTVDAFIHSGEEKEKRRKSKSREKDYPRLILAYSQHY
jgi:hypothetical protein